MVNETLTVPHRACVTLTEAQKAAFLVGDLAQVPLASKKTRLMESPRRPLSHGVEPHAGQAGVQYRLTGARSNEDRDAWRLPEV
jgi:hypothetical protein